MAQRGFVVAGAGVLLLVAGACTLSTSGIDSGEASGAGAGSSTVGSGGAFRVLARYWLMFLGAYAVLLGTAGAFFAHPDSRFAVAWQGLNLWAAMVHSTAPLKDVTRATAM